MSLPTVTAGNHEARRWLERARERPALPDPEVAARLLERQRRRVLSEEELFRAHGLGRTAAA